MSAVLNLGDKITAGNRADATFFYKKRVLADSGTLLTEAETDANNRELLAQKLFDKASIVYTAGGVKASKAYSVKGTDFGVTRAGVKNVVNRAGLLTEIPANTPATEFAGGVLKGTLIEPARTNLLLRSEEFDDEYWTKTNLNTTGTPPWVNVAVAPDGTTTAEKLIADTTVGLHTVLRAISVVAGSAYTFSIYAKKSQYDFVFVRTGPSGAGLSTRTSIVNLTNGTIVSETVVGQTKVIDANNGWYRIAVTTAVTTGSGAPSFSVGALDNSAGTDFAGNDSDGIFIWGAQIEASSVATSYIKTVDTAITQPADVITAIGVSGDIGQTEGAVLVEVDLRNPKQESNGIIALTSAINNDGTNRVAITKGDSKTIGLGIRANDTLVVSIFTVSEWTNGINKIGVRYKSGESAMYVNGVLVGTSVNNFTFTQVLNNVKIGYFFGFPQFFINDSISQALIFKQALTDQEIQTWTTL
jgi:hypothetical protein